MLLLDTHVLLWWLADDPSLCAKARALIGDENNLVFVSSASVWEIVIKKALGKLKAPDNIETALEANNFKELPITTRHALVISLLPDHHQDPFDRMLIAQAKCESLTLITTDEKIIKYDVPFLKT